jgi:hypothetical protein
MCSCYNEDQKEKCSNFCEYQKLCILVENNESDE